MKPDYTNPNNIYSKIIFILVLSLIFSNQALSQNNSTTEYPDSYWIERAHIRPNPFIEKQVGGVVRDIFEDSKGNLWFGTEDGPFRYDGKNLEFFDDIKNQFGQGVTIKEIAEDQKGNLWFGHTGGISKYNGHKFTNYNEKDGLISDDVWKIGIDKKGIVWIGTTYGTCSFDGKSFTKFELPESQRDSSKGISSTKIIHSIFSDSKGNLWFGTNGGAYKYDGESLTNISEIDGLCSNFVNKIIEDRIGNIWFVTSRNGICVYDGKSFKNIEELNEFNEKEVWDIL
ncbi:MAG: two-component regulator propeller domain-containing protein, partial [Candidatus Kapaibacterium sp.]